jgi:hypothetical protein
VKKILISEGLPFFKEEDKSIQQMYTMMGGDLRKIINCIQATFCRQNQHDEKMLLDNESIDTIFSFHQQEDLQLFVEILYKKPLKEAIHFLNDRMNNKSQDFRVWMGLAFEYVLNLPNIRSSKFQQPFTDYVTNLSEIEYNTSFLVDFRVQMYAFVSLTRHLLRLYYLEESIAT